MVVLLVSLSASLATVPSPFLPKPWYVWTILNMFPKLVSSLYTISVNHELANNEHTCEIALADSQVSDGYRALRKFVSIG